MDIRTRGRFTAGGWLALAVAGLALAVGVEGAQAAFPGANGRIAFAVVKWRLPDPCLPEPHGCEPEQFSSSIETVLPSGRGRRVLRAVPVDPGAGAPVWSPSGRALTFTQGIRLAIMRGDGTGLRLLPRLTSGEGSPTWSPHGRRLAFTGSGICCNWLYTVRADGTGLRRVLAQQALFPAWSATGTIAFVHGWQRPQDSRLRAGLYTIGPDGSRLRRLSGRKGRPDWSPDGSRIAFGGVFTVRADGRGLRRLTVPPSGPGPTGDPAWSPDGKYIAFLRGGDLYVMRSNGGGLRRIVDAPQQDVEHPERAWAELSAPSWQPLPR